MLPSLHAELSRALMRDRIRAAEFARRRSERRDDRATGRAVPLSVAVVLPEADFVERHQRRVAAPPATVWKALHDVRLADSPLSAALMTLRRLPVRRAGGPARGLQARPLIEQPLVPVLAVAPGRAVVAGAVMQPWKLRGGARPPALDARELTAFHEPGWVKCAVDFTLDGDDAGTVVRTETRVLATDAATRARFALYWLVIRGGSGLIRRELLRTVARRAEAAHLDAFD